ncbi:MAG TPA: hypothetical protein VM328_01965, partial [Fimbriimonadaceae bacterium]|nr:hypothetical protein [Fimbriimonadaceae bacterium]
LLRAARRNGVEVIWDLFHYGYPRDLDILSDKFVARYADYVQAAAKYLRARTEGTLYITPVNEPSFLAWAGGEAQLFRPFLRGAGWELKVQLARAAILGAEAVWAVDPDAVIVSVDPTCRVALPWGREDLRQEQEHFNEHVVFQSWDLVCGRLCPELGGSRRHLGVPGINYYWTAQWELHRAGVALDDDDPRRVPLREIVRDVWTRYGGKLLITETSHKPERRGEWITEVTNEALALWREGVPLQGVCLYPVLGMPEWHAPEDWTCMGLWDIQYQDGSYDRIPCEPAHLALARAAQKLEHAAPRVSAY